MPASVVPITGRREGAYVLLSAVLPERPSQNIGVFLFDPVTDRGWVRMRDSYRDLADPDDIEVLEALEEHVQAAVAESGAGSWLASVEDSLSNVLRVSERQPVAVDAFSRVIDRLFEEHVDKLRIEPFRTHVPLYSLRAAAGGLGEEMESEAEDWVRAPEGMRLGPDLFVAHVEGRSMEPRIPDGSLNLFRLHPAGSRQNRILLIERFGVLDQTARYTIKRYTSTKVAVDEDQWRHERIRLEPLNPEFEPWDVQPEDFAVVAEWLRVIE
ncbi:MAG TPA: S24 family peptidase [Bryobacteraceae bacterium]|jgi:SOS-response transcriptional repressor LexA